MSSENHFLEMRDSDTQARSVKDVLIWRIYAAAITVGAYSCWGYFVIALIRGEETSFWIWLLVAMPLFGQLCFLAFNVRVFSWRFSVLGRERRRLPPADAKRLIKMRGSGTIANKLHTQFITWIVCEGGVIIDIDCIGKGFVPREHVRRLEPNVGWGCRLEHDWPEIRSPIIMPCEVAKEFAKICPPQAVMI